MKKSFKKKSDDTLENFLARIEVLTSKINEVSRNTEEAQELQSKLLNEPSQNERKKIFEVQQGVVGNNNKLGKEIYKELKNEKVLNQKLESSGTTASELTIRKSQVQSLLQNYKDVWEAYNNNQLEFRDKNKKALLRNIKITDPNSNITTEELEKKLEDGDLTVLSSIIKETQQAKEDLEVVERRHKEMVKLEKGITEISELFIDLSRLVEMQGEQVLRIEDAVMKAQVDVEQGADQLNQAKKNKRKARKKKFILAGILAGVSLILLIALIFAFL